MKALVLAGGFPQIELLKQLKVRGIETVLADTMEDLRAKHARAVAELKVIAEDGSDMMRRDLLVNIP